MLALVGLLFLIANMAPLFLYGLLDADMNGTLGPSDPWLIVGASLCSVPILAVLAFLVEAFAFLQLDKASQRLESDLFPVL